MGWLYTHDSTRKQLFEERTKSWTRDTVDIDWIRENGDGNVPPNVKPEDYRFEAVCLKRCFRGSAWKGTLWTVWERRAINKVSGDLVASHRYIGCDLFQYDKSCSGWGYKDMCESSGPYVFNCPLSYLELVPCPGGYATEWREGVREYHGPRVKLHVGDTVRLRDCALDTVTIACLKPLRARSPDGTLYKLRRKLITGVVTA